MPRTASHVQRLGVQAHMILQVHDELVFEVREQDQEAVAAVVKDVMENACEPAIQLSGSEYPSFLIFPPGPWKRILESACVLGRVTPHSPSNCSTDPVLNPTL